MIGPVPQSTILCIGISCIAGILIPVALFIYFRAKRKADAMPFFIGCLIFFVFVMLLESGINAAVITTTGLQNNIVLYALYGGIMAGLFEEVGRFLALRFIKRKKGLKDVNALMYGAGHGGFEVLMVLGVTMFGNLTYAAAINSGGIDQILSTLSGDALDQVMAVLNTLVDAPSYIYLIGIAERILAVALHIALSVLVWFAVSRNGKGWLFPLAIVIHAAVDFIAALTAGLGVPTLAVEAIVLVLTAAVCIFTYKIWKDLRVEDPASAGKDSSPAYYREGPTL